MKKIIPILGILGACALLAFLILYAFQKAPGDAVLDVSGPEDASTIIPAPPTPFTRYETGSKSRLAVLLTVPDSSWLGLAHGLKSIGVPFIVTDDYRRALEHRVVLVYPIFSGGVMSSEALRAVLAHPRLGGVLIAQNAIAGGMGDVFGFENAVAGRNRLSVKFAERQPGGLLLSDVREQTIKLGNPNLAEEVLGTYGYTNPRETPLAEYDDGTAALTRRSFGTGKAYAVGLDLGDFILRCHNGRTDWLSSGYINIYAPACDVLLRWLRAMYLDAEPEAVTLGTVPGGRAFTLLMTHDIDAQKSVRNSLIYARLEQAYGFRASYFMQAKYVRDWNDNPLLTRRTAGFLAELAGLGMEIASHSVSHSTVFDTFPQGTGRERYPEYRPFVVDRKTAEDGTVLGELRVSKFLLEHFGKQPVVSFRPGNLRNPKILPQALQATGYHFSSTLTAGESLTHLPFQLNYDQTVRAEVPVFEFPISIEDTTPISLDELQGRAISLMDSLASYGGAGVILIHPNIVGAKLEFEKKLLEAAGNRAWTGSIREFGEWWAARDKVGVDVTAAGRRRTVRLEIPDEIENMTLFVPEDWALSAGESRASAEQTRAGLIVLKKASGKAELSFVISGEPE